MSFLSRTDKSFIGRWWWTVDRILLSLFIALMVIGVFMVATASPPVASRIGLSEYHFIIRHLIVLIPSFLLMVGLSLLDIKTIWRFSLFVFIGSLVALVYVPIFGMEIKGAQRWIHLPGFSLQPSEFAKPAFIIVVSYVLASRKEMQGFSTAKISAALYGTLIMLLALQPDMGMAFVVTACFVAVIFLAGLPLRIVFLLLSFTAGALTLAYFTFSHFKSRIDRFLDPESGDTYQIEKSMEAFGNGGFWGAGPAQGTVKLHIPDAHADFIFSVVGEEFGLFFTAIIIALYGYIIFRGFNRLMDSENMFVILASGGLLTMFGLQTLIHMGSALNLLPTKGMTLPFISYGGSSLLSMSMAMGIVLALTRRQGRSGIAHSGWSARPIGGDKL
jgi:cell division protein FtsW